MARPVSTMKLIAALSLLLGFPSVLAAHVFNDFAVAAPPRADSAALLPGASADSASPAATQVSSGASADLTILHAHGPESEHLHRNGDLRRRAASSSSSSASSAASASGSASSSSGSSSSKNSTTTAAAIYVASYPADGTEWVATSESGYVMIDGHTLSIGGPDAIIGGDTVTEASKGLIVDGTTLTLTKDTHTTSASSAAAASSAPASVSAVAGSSSAVAKSSSSSKAAAASSTSSSNAAPRATVVHGANAAAVIGAVVGAMIL